jgi:hypothetical protein
MSLISIRSRALALGVLCAAGGAGVGAVASATASTGHSSTASAHHARAADGKANAHGKAIRRARMVELRKVAQHSVSGNVVVDSKQGFETISFERGTVDSVNGNQITITEGGPKATQRQETITVPSTVHVRDNGKKASMSSVSAGQHVLVLTLPKRTVVVARTPKHAAS